MNEYYLEHHGVKGMKWGVRRYQNKDGSLTSAEKIRKDGYKKDPLMDKYGELSDQYKIQQKMRKRTTSLTSAEKKRLVKSGVSIATVTAAAYYVHKNPEKIGKVISQFKGVKVNSVKQKTVDTGKKAVDTILKSAKEGVKEGLRDAPKKATKAIVTGTVMNITKRAVDSAVGKEESARIFQANDNKKIAKFWKVSPEDRDDDD